MTVVLLVLKIIGIVLLAVLGLLAFLFLLALFVPVRYRAAGSFHEKVLVAKVRVSWLLHLFTVAYDASPEQSALYLWICGIPKNLQKADNPNDFEETKEERGMSAEGDSGAKSRAASKEDFDAKSRSASKEDSGARYDEAVEEDYAENGEPAPKSFFERLWDRPRAVWQRGKDLLERIRRLAADISGTSKKLGHFLTDEGNQNAFRYLWGRALLLLKRIAPGKFKLTLAYSTGSPDTTGELLGILAMFPACYRNRWNITPDFTADRFYAEADFDVRGRVFLFQMLGIIISVVWNKDCRGVIKNIKNIK